MLSSSHQSSGITPAMHTTAAAFNDEGRAVKGKPEGRGCTASLNDAPGVKGRPHIRFAVH